MILIRFAAAEMRFVRRMEKYAGIVYKR